MKRLLGGADERIARWVQKHCPLLELTTPYTAIGLLDQAGAELVAGVVYDTFTGHNIEVHTAAVGKPWTRLYLGECFRYPFEQLKVERLTAKIAANNAASRAFVEGLGFKLEGTLRQWLPSGTDLMIYGMLKSECRWLQAGLHG